MEKINCKIGARLLIATILLIFAVNGQTTSIENDPGPVYIKVTREWLEVTEFAKNTTKTTMNKLTIELEKDARVKNSITPAFLEELNQFFIQLYSSPEISIQLAKVYIQYFTLDEMLDLINFYKTPTGQKFVKSSTEIAQKSQMISEEMFKMHQREYMEIIKKYIKPVQ